ncbi:MAG: DUF5666 domain-containing protein [bacterium]
MPSKKYYSKFFLLPLIFLVSVCAFVALIVFNVSPVLASSTSIGYRPPFKLNLTVFEPNINKNSQPIPGKSPAAGAYIYDGTIESISSNSLSIYKGTTIIISGNTVCKAPASGMTKFRVVSCSSLSKGETVRITAVKDSAGQFTATVIEKVFY